MENIGPVIFAIVWVITAVYVVRLMLKAFRECWLPLETQYKAEKENKFPEIKFQSLSYKLKYGHFFLRNCIAIEIAKDYLGIRPMFPFSFFMKRIEIPWSQIQKIEEKKLLFGWSHIIITINNFAAPLQIYGKSIQAVLKKKI